MRRLLLSITIVSAGWLFAGNLQAQQQGSVRDRINQRQQAQQKKQSQQLTVRAENMNLSQTQEIANAPWMREVYRFLDLNKEKNSSLYYPVTPIGDRVNLFTLMFRLLSNNEVTAYEFPIDRIETFTDADRLNFKDLLERWNIMHTELDGNFVVEASDIPSNEITGYYVKEAWYFDKSNSVVDIKILAISPVMLSQDDFEAESQRYPLFWMPYEEIRPYAARMPIMTSNLNNASNQTIDDFFRKREFDGEIYKTTNMKNMALADIVRKETPNFEELPPIMQDSLINKERNKVEGELKQFKENLWSFEEAPAEEKAKGKQEKIAGKASDKEESEDVKEKASDSKKASDQKVRTNEPKKSSNTPVRSMRGRRR